jgi:hypothetical protein
VVIFGIHNVNVRNNRNKLEFITGLPYISKHNEPTPKNQEPIMTTITANTAFQAAAKPLNRWADSRDLFDRVMEVVEVLQAAQQRRAEARVRAHLLRTAELDPRVLSEIRAIETRAQA